MNTVTHVYDLIFHILYQDANIMAVKWMVECPCGFKFSTPHGQDDAIAVTQMHIKRVHNIDIAKEDAVKSIKEIGETHLSMGQIPVDKFGDYEVRTVQWGNVNVSFEKAVSDMDVTPLLKGLPNDLGQSPHWGFVFKGEFISKYKGHEEHIKAREAYYTASRHTTLVKAGTELLEFSPVRKIEKTFAAIMKNLQDTEFKKSM